LLSPLPLTSLIYPKLIALWLVTELPLILLMPLTALLFHLSFSTMLILSLSLLLGTPILTLIGGLGVALTLGLRQQGIFLGLLILPLVTPVLIFGVGIVQQFQAGFDITAPLALLAGLLVLAITLLPFAIACTVKTVIDS